MYLFQLYREQGPELCDMTVELEAGRPSRWRGRRGGGAEPGQEAAAGAPTFPGFMPVLLGCLFKGLFRNV